MRKCIGFTSGIIALMIGWSPGLVTGCGGGARTDTVDADDATTTGDASLLPDGAPDLDEDGDTFPASVDCDDHDPDIYPGSGLVECLSECDVGFQGCQSDGQFSACTARTDCDCTTPGETRLIDCGQRCGLASQRCEPDLVWSFPGECLNEGECSFGEEETVPCDFCGGTGTRLCNEDCQWLPMEGCGGDCVPGEVERGSAGCPAPWEVQERECDTQCQWVVSQPCTTSCLVTPRTPTPSLFDDEVCVSAGPALIGQLPGASHPEEEPQHTVQLTPYLIDIYEVVNDRYRLCVDAGACTAPPSWSYYHVQGHGDCAIDGVNYDQAVTFCLWDGGRLLPTEAQWEKAARGPAPRDVVNPWGTDPATCSHVLISDCEGGLGPYSVTLAQLGVSYYGLYHQASNAREWVADWFDANYYAVSPTVDPTGPANGIERVIRGMGYGSIIASYHDTVTIRYWLDPAGTTEDLGFRCARPGY